MMTCLSSLCYSDRRFFTPPVMKWAALHGHMIVGTKPPPTGTRIGDAGLRRSVLLGIVSVNHDVVWARSLHAAIVLSAEVTRADRRRVKIGAADVGFRWDRSGWQ